MATFYTDGIHRIATAVGTDAVIDLEADNLGIMLYDDSISYTPDPDHGPYLSDLLTGTAPLMAEPGDASYSRKTTGGGDITVSTSVDDANNRVDIDVTDPTWSSLSTTNQIQGYVFYRVGPTDDTDAVILAAVDDTDSADLPLPTNGSDVTINIDAAGWGRLTVV